MYTPIPSSRSSLRPTLCNNLHYTLPTIKRYIRIPKTETHPSNLLGASAHQRFKEDNYTTHRTRGQPHALLSKTTPATHRNAPLKLHETSKRPNQPTYHPTAARTKPRSHLAGQSNLHTSLPERERVPSQVHQPSTYQMRLCRIAPEAPKPKQRHPHPVPVKGNHHTTLPCPLHH